MVHDDGLIAILSWVFELFKKCKTILFDPPTGWLSWVLCRVSAWRRQLALVEMKWGATYCCASWKCLWNNGHWMICEVYKWVACGKIYLKHKPWLNLVCCRVFILGTYWQWGLLCGPTVDVELQVLYADWKTHVHIKDQDISALMRGYVLEGSLHIWASGAYGAVRLVTTKSV